MSSFELLQDKGKEYRIINSFNDNLPIYQKIITATERDGKISKTGNYKGVSFEIEVNNNVTRVAFPIRGILDNWEAIIYDPTDKVSEANGINDNGEFSAPDEIKMIFGGDLIYCKPIQDKFYRCWFT